jgi:hypothetical protein
METIGPVVEKRIRMSTDRAMQLSNLAETYDTNEDRLVEKALDIFFSLAEVFHDSDESIQTPSEEDAPVINSQFTEERFKQRLVELGLIKEIKNPPASYFTKRPKPIEVKGKPLSEVIIEERR